MKARAGPCGSYDNPSYVLKKKEFRRNKCVYGGFHALSKNLTFEESVTANDCSIYRDEREGGFFAEKIRNS